MGGRASGSPSLRLWATRLNSCPDFSSFFMLQIAGEGLTIANRAGRRCFGNQRKPPSDEEKPRVSKAGGCKENQKRRL